MSSDMTQDKNEEKESLLPKHEYFLDKSTKYFEVNSNRIKIQ